MKFIEKYIELRSTVKKCGLKKAIEIQLLLEATQNLKVEEDYKKITRFYPRPTVIYVLVFLHSVVSFYKKFAFLYHSYYQTLLNLH